MIGPLPVASSVLPTADREAMEDSSYDSEKTLDQVLDPGPSIDTIVASFLRDLNRGSSEEREAEGERPAAEGDGLPEHRIEPGLSHDETEARSKSRDPARTAVVEDTVDAFRSALDESRVEKGSTGSRGRDTYVPGPASEAQVISVCSHKGGTGKTTTAIHLAAALGLSGRRSLVVDLDPQGFLTQAINGREPAVDQSVAAFFDPVVETHPLPIQDVSGFDLIPASSTLTRRMQDLNAPSDVLWVREALAEAELEYDFIFFDTAAAMTVYSLNALVASQHVLIPVLPEYQSVVGGEQTYQTAQLVKAKLNPQLESAMFLLTQVDGRKQMHQTYQEHVREKYGADVLGGVVRTNAALARVREEGQTVFDRDSGSRGAQDYARVADEVVGRVQEAEMAENHLTCAQNM